MKPKENPSKTRVSALDLGFLPGTEGTGRVAATLKSGLPAQEPYIPSATRISATIGPVAAVHFTPVLGSLSGRTAEAINATYYGYYNYLRSRNMSLGAYVPVDVIKAFFAIANLDILFGYVRSCITILNTKASPVNGAFMQGLETAKGLSITDRKELAEIISTYNQCVKLAEQFILPKDFKLGARYIALSSVIYADDPVIEKTQAITFEPTGYWALDVDASSSTVGKLMFVKMPANIRAVLQELLVRIQLYALDQDMQNIFAEVRRAYSDAEVYRFAEYTGETVQLVFDQTLMDQLKNGILVGLCIGANTSRKFLIGENSTGGLQYEYPDKPAEHRIMIKQVYYDDEDWDEIIPQMEMTKAALWAPEDYVFYYTHENQPTENQIAALSAFKATFSYDGSKEENFVRVIESCGSEVLNFVRLITNEEGGDGEPIVKIYGHINSVNFVTQSADSTLYNTYMDWVRTELLFDSFSSLPTHVRVMCSGLNDDEDELDQSFIERVFLVEGEIDNRFEVGRHTVDLIHRNTLIYLLSPDK